MRQSMGIPTRATDIGMCADVDVTGAGNAPFPRIAELAWESARARSRSGFAPQGWPTLRADRKDHVLDKGDATIGPPWPTNRWGAAKAITSSRSAASVTEGTAPPEEGDQLPPGLCNTTPSVHQAHTRRSRGETLHARVGWRADLVSHHSNPRGRT